MADPITLGTIGMAAGTAGGLTKAFGSFMGGQSSGDAFQYKAGIAKINQKIDDENADYQEYVGEVKAQTVGMRDAARIAETKTIQSASGLDVNFGSGADVRASEQALAQQDQAITRANANRQAYGYKVKAMNEGVQATMDERAGDNARTSGAIEGLGSILGAASSVSGKWLEGNRLGMWGGHDDEGEVGGEAAPSYA